MKSIKSLLVLTLVVGMMTGCATTSQAPQQPARVVATEDPPLLRLDDRAVPKAYRVHLRLDPDVETFTGEIEIDLDVKRPSTILWLNATDLEIASASLERGGLSNDVAEILEGNQQTAGFRFPSAVPAGPATMHVTFSGKYDHISSEAIFRQKDGDEWYLFTQFQAIYGRRAIPSFDDPFHKTPWTMTIDTTPGNRVYANTPLEQMTEGVGSGWNRFEFATSEPLPSYLVAFAVGPFEEVNAGMVGDTPLRILTPKGKAEEATYARGVTPAILRIGENYVGIPYPYAKLDSIAVPQTVGFGAMENVGLVTYVEPLLLETPGEETPAFMRRHTEVVAHEIAHMWFGNYVTPKWWDDIWLNESFAAWFETGALQVFAPEWEFELEAVGTRRGAFNADSLETARRVREPIVDENDIDRAFDSITYSKGATLLGAYEDWLGEEPFRRGLRAYLLKYAHGNATAADFLAVLEAETQPGVAASFSSFLDQSGIPVLEVALDCTGSRPTVRMAQQRYLPVGSLGERDRTWQIPVCLRWDGGRTCALVDDPVEVVELPSERCPAWLQANDGGLGYYLTAYEGELGNSLIEEGNLTIAEQLARLGDAELLADGGYTPISDVIEQAAVAARSDSRHLVARSAGVLSGLDPHYLSSSTRDAYANLVDELFRDRVMSLGLVPVEGESEDAALLRSSIVSLVAARGADDALRLRAAELARKWLDDEVEIPDSSLGRVLVAAAHTDDPELYERFRSALFEAKERPVRRALVAALATFDSPELVQRTLPLMLDERLDPRELLALRNAGSSAEARAASWAFIRANWDALMGRFPAQWGSYFGYGATYTCDASTIPEVRAFLEERMAKLPAGPQALDRIVEVLQLCDALKQLHEPAVEAYLMGR